MEEGSEEDEEDGKAEWRTVVHKEKEREREREREAEKEFVRNDTP